MRFEVRHVTETTTTPQSRPAPPFAAVPVELAERRYEVLIGPGLIRDAVTTIERLLGPVRCGIVTDRHVAALHLAPLEASLAARGRHAGTLVLEPGEATKSMERLAEVTDGLIAMGLERSDIVIALGGGVIGDLAGFAASVIRRGLRYVQIPTTLLAQVDSSVGGKTAVNSRHGKNLIGAFHQPALVLADTDVLSTLPAREMRAGYAEVVKYGLLGDRRFYDWLTTHHASLFGNDAARLTEAVCRCVAAKAAIVARDETETGDRMLLNLGHTFGHALEAWAGYSSRLLHGEAVAIGMAQAFRYSEQAGLCPPGTAATVAAHLAAAGLPTRISEIAGPDRPTADELLRLMSQDKKVKAGRMTFILVRGIGEAFITREVEMAPLRAFLEAEIGLR
jgi:3-dehydroquinate synthase